MAEQQSILQVLPASPFPNLTYKDEDGTEHRLSDERGKLTIVHFWATWCDPCVSEFPELDRVQARFAPRGMRVIAISMDGRGNYRKVREFYHAHNIAASPARYDTSNAAFKAAKTRGLPTSYFLDGNGMKIAIAEGPLDWESKDTLSFIEFHLRAAR